MTVFSLSGQFIDLISPITRTLAEQGKPVRIQFMHLIHTYISLRLQTYTWSLADQISSFCMTLLSFCLSFFCSFLFLLLLLKIYFLADILLLCFLSHQKLLQPVLFRFTDGSQNEGNAIKVIVFFLEENFRFLFQCGYQF